MKYLSVCAGIEAATVAWHPLGWEPVGFSEIEKFPSSVLKHHYPDVPNYGDMTDHERWPKTDIDLLVGGTPCQSFSVAGLRAGMADPRGNLALVYLAIADRFRPDWLVWENVPGVLSSNEGRDFGSIIGGMVELGYSPSWRVLDAQYFGVPQRRRRVFVVASARHWTDSAKVLFEPESLRRNPPPSRGARKDIAACIGASPASSNQPNVGNGQGNVVVAADTYNGAIDDVSVALGTSSEHYRNTAIVPEISKSIRGNSGGIDREDMHTLIPDVVGALSDGAHCGGGLNGQDAYSGRIIPTTAAPLTSGSSSPGVNPPGRRQEDDENIVAFRENQRAEVTEHDIADALLSGGGKPGNGYPAIRDNMAVRRLTPLECERLQGFPDGYTDIPGASDSGRYRALGNSMAVPVMRWIGQRIAAVNGETE